MQILTLIVASLAIVLSNGFSVPITEADESKWTARLKDEDRLPLEKIKGFYRYHFFYFTPSVKRSIETLSELRKKFPIDPDVHDILDVDAQQIC